jgi:hypothetical protein
MREHHSGYAQQIFALIRTDKAAEALKLMITIQAYVCMVYAGDTAQLLGHGAIQGGAAGRVLPVGLMVQASWVRR